MGDHADGSIKNSPLTNGLCSQALTVFDLFVCQNRFSCYKLGKLKHIPTCM